MTKRRNVKWDNTAKVGFSHPLGYIHILFVTESNKIILINYFCFFIEHIRTHTIMNQTKLLLFIIITLFFFTLNGYSQVTIGSAVKAVEGALLQLKENEDVGANSTKGLLLPRVTIIDLESIEFLDGALQTEALKYTGTVVYNIQKEHDTCYTIPMGLFVWDGNSWIGLDSQVKYLDGNLETDLTVLKEIATTNLGNDLGFGWNSIDVSSTIMPNIEGCKFENICGNIRLTELEIKDKNIKYINLVGLDALISLRLADLLNATFDGAELDLNNKDNLVSLQLTNLPSVTLSDLDLRKKDYLSFLFVGNLPNALFDGAKLGLNDKPRLTGLQLFDLPNVTFKSNDLDLKKSTLMEYLLFYNLTNVTFSGSDLDLVNKNNLIYLQLTNLPNATFNNNDLDLNNKNNLTSIFIGDLPNATFSASDLDLGSKQQLEYIHLYNLPNAIFNGSNVDLSNKPRLKNLVIKNIVNASFTQNAPLDLRQSTTLENLELDVNIFQNKSVRITSTTLGNIPTLNLVPDSTSDIYNTGGEDVFIQKFKVDMSEPNFPKLSTIDTSLDISKIEWVFPKEEQISDRLTVTHYFEQKGTYPVTLKYNYPDGTQSTYTYNIVIEKNSSYFDRGETLIWQDEFETSRLDLNSWTKYTGTVYNEESQTYMDDEKHSYIENGKLILKATLQDNKYLSAKLITENKVDIRGKGRLEVKAKLAGGKGTWPAIWLYGGWDPNAYAEIDIMEYVGKEKGMAYCALHTQRTLTGEVSSIGSNKMISDAEDVFHIYGLNIEKDNIVIYIDNDVVLDHHEDDITNSRNWPFTEDRGMYIILNLALGGSWGGEIDNSIFPCQMEIEYVRLFK